MMRLLEEDLKGRPCATHSQRAKFLFAVCGVKVSEATVCRAVGRLSRSRKKIQRGSGTRRVFLRLIWRMEMGDLDSWRLVFVDEMGAHTSLAPLYAYAPVGEQAFFEVPRNRATNTTLLASLHSEEAGLSMAVEGATNKEVFEAYLEHFLAPPCGRGRSL